MALTSPEWLSETTNRTPQSPRSRKLRKNAVQDASLSLSSTITPTTSRVPCSLTPVAITTACETIWWFTRA
ncbi:hypothetical protein GCM10010353_66320 [Streptomyces chryseus]|nr:hypothetical protein GCM10010353_66320 [Streptomyces chryseus]